jgi:PAS domain S-box-containing protein
MKFAELPIRRKIMTAIMLTSITVVILTAAAFMIHDLTNSRKDTIRGFTTLARGTAWNSTAALAFKNENDAREALSSLRAEPQIVRAALYDTQGVLFATYPATAPTNAFPAHPEPVGYHFNRSHLLLFEAVSQNNTRFGTLYLQADLRFFYSRIQLYAALAALIILGSIVVSLVLSNRLQKNVADPILALAGTARRVSEWGDYSVRAEKISSDELGTLTDAFNQMLTRIQEQTLAIQESEERLRLALEASRTGTWDWNVVTGRVLWDERNAALFGLKPGEFRGTYEHFLELIHKQDYDAVARALDESLEKKTRFLTEFQVVWADGSVHDMLARGRAFYDEAGRPVRMSGITQDITESKQTEEASRRLAAIVESTDDAIVGKTLNGIVTSWNQSAERIFGYSAHEMVGRSIERIAAPEDAGFEQRVLDVVRNGQTSSYETQRVRKDGTRLYVALTISPVRNAEGKIIGASSISRDITDRKRAEEQILQMNLELEQRVKARTSELFAANQELEAFTYSVAHDLRAPLRHIDAFTKIIFEDYAAALPAEVRHYLENIRKGSQNMNHLVDDLLNLARVGRQELKRELTPLTPIVNEVIRDMKHETEKRQIEWRIRPLPTVRCDPGLMRQVFINLLSNAVKYTRPRTAAVIEIGQEEVGDSQAVYIRDNGVGFNMKYANKLFGVFQRLHRADEFEGTGVGLATVARIVGKHGGRIWADSELNQGATFYFTLNELEKPVPGEKDPNKMDWVTPEVRST